ncbi:MAG TPA: LLM class flavin-dependent oxidoreductase [Trebonia sp.]
MELGILTLGDLQRDPSTGRAHRPVDRTSEILGYAALADELGLDVFAVGEHHRPGFFTSAPAVVLAAAAARTTSIRLASATTLLRARRLAQARAVHPLSRRRGPAICPRHLPFLVTKR